MQVLSFLCTCIVGNTGQKSRHIRAVGAWKICGTDSDGAREIRSRPISGGRKRERGCGMVKKGGRKWGGILRIPVGVMATGTQAFLRSFSSSGGALVRLRTVAAGASPRPTVCAQFPLICRGDHTGVTFVGTGVPDGPFLPLWGGPSRTPVPTGLVRVFRLPCARGAGGDSRLRGCSVLFHSSLPCNNPSGAVRHHLPLHKGGEVRKARVCADFAPGAHLFRTKIIFLSKKS